MTVCHRPHIAISTLQSQVKPVIMAILNSCHHQRHDVELISTPSPTLRTNHGPRGTELENDLDPNYESDDESVVEEEEREEGEEESDTVTKRLIEMGLDDALEDKEKASNIVQAVEYIALQSLRTRELKPSQSSSCTIFRRSESMSAE
ncbi:hypothetical protein CHS0354_012621 [Potamilus streckersoni]|uniref:Uncharacterized protein n=1 Tax=Potamilus streckersoni TaxID=2493646 RepID=A0AAE0W2S7_9BIVA|nr:hypothetical protein CHS0354_012621 [Potamilus streckersoni]